MKKAFYLLSLTSLLVFSSFTLAQRTDHIGVWNAEIDGEEGTFIFDKDGYFTMIIDGDTMGGKSMITDEGEEAQGLYTINYDAKPQTLDLTFRNITADETYTIEAIFKFIDKTHWLICIGDNEEIRPTSFEDGESVTFVKVQ